MSTPAPISFGVTYTPRLAGHSWWQALDRAAVADELAQIADIGIDTLRLSLTWEEFQPGPKRVGGRALGALEQALDLAQAAGLRVVPLLFPALCDGALRIPSWANGLSLVDELVAAERSSTPLALPAAGGLPVLYDGSYHPNHARDLFSYRPLLAAQRYLIGEVVGYFARHPAIARWQLGEGFERVRRPGAPQAARTWYSSMADAVRQRHAGAQLLGVASLRALAWRHGPRPDDILAGCDAIGVSADPPEPLAQPARHTTYAAFAHATVAGLADRPTIVTSLGMPTTAGRGGEWRSERVFTRARPVFYADVEQQAAFLVSAIERLAAAGAAGVWLAAFADVPQARWGEPPYDRAPRSRALGIVDAAGREKLAAQALREAIRSARAAAATPARQLVDPEWLAHDPRGALAELWAGFEDQRR